jgi:preprotein translocase subunit YajC
VSEYAVGSRVVHIPTGQAGVVVKVYEDGLLVRVGVNDWLRFPMDQWKGEK